MLGGFLKVQLPLGAVCPIYLAELLTGWTMCTWRVLEQDGGWSIGIR